MKDICRVGRLIAIVVVFLPLTVLSETTDIESALGQLRVGMTIEEVSQVLEVPEPKYQGNLQQIESFIAMANSVRAAGSDMSFYQQICIDRSKEDCVETTSIEEAEAAIASAREYAELNRTGPDYELVFDSERLLERWSKTDGDRQP